MKTQVYCAAAIVALAGVATAAQAAPSYTITDLTTLTGGNYIYGINDSGQVVGGGDKYFYHPLH